MTREIVDISKGGIKTSALTFISDHSTSLIVVAFLVTAYYFPIFGNSLKIYKTFGLPIEDKIFISILILLLLHPFGLFIDAFGWMLFGWMEKSFETFHFKTKTFFTQGTKNYLCFQTLISTFKLTTENFYEKTRQEEYFLATKHLDILFELDYLLGTSILLRNLTTCSIPLLIVFLIMGHFLSVLLVLIIAIIFILINTCVSFFYSLSILMFSSKLTCSIGLESKEFKNGSKPEDKDASH